MSFKKQSTWKISRLWHSASCKEEEEEDAGGMHPSGASQHCQICWRGQAAHWKIWDVNAFLDLAVISGKGQKRGAPGGQGPLLDSAGSGDAGGTHGEAPVRGWAAGLGAWGLSV